MRAENAPTMIRRQICKKKGDTECHHLQQKTQKNYFMSHTHHMLLHFETTTKMIDAMMQPCDRRKSMLSPNENGACKKFQKWEILRCEFENGKLAKFETKGTKKRKRGRTGLRVTWMAKSRICGVEDMWCQNHPKLFVCCERARDVCPCHCEDSCGHRSCVAGRIVPAKAEGETTTNVGHESDDPDEPERLHCWEQHIDQLNQEEEPCSQNELGDMEERFALVDKMEAFDSLRVESDWKVQGNMSDHSCEEN